MQLTVNSKMLIKCVRRVYILCALVIIIQYTCINTIIDFTAAAALNDIAIILNHRAFSRAHLLKFTLLIFEIITLLLLKFL